jgi:hypothetical protein
MSKTLMANNAVWARATTSSFSLPTAQRERSIRIAGLSKLQAEDLLDWLEANAYRDYHLTYTAGRGFTISYSWVDPPVVQP